MPLFLGALIGAVVSLARPLPALDRPGTPATQVVRVRRVRRRRGSAEAFLLWYVTPAAGVIAAVALSGLPLAAGAAILRYRLYDIDLFISRTVAYAA